MTNVTHPHWESVTDASGITSASLLVVTLVATAMGGLTGLAFESAAHPVAIAILAGLVGTVVAGLVRNTLLISAWGAAGIADVGTPSGVIS